MDPALVGALLAALAIGGVGFALLGGESAVARKRLKTVVKSKAEAAAAAARSNDPAAVRRAKIAGTLKDLDAKEKKARAARASLSARIEQAGLAVSEKTFWLASLCVGAGVGVMLFLAVPSLPILAAAGAFVAGLGLPRWVLGFLAKGRVNKFSREFPNAMEVIVRGVKSGLPLNECLRVIAREAPEPLAGEFTRLTDSLAMGVSMDQALEKMFRRMPLPEVNFFGIVLLIQQRAGGNLSEALQNLASVLRGRKLMKEKIKALSSEATASAMIIGFLPIAVTVLVYLTSPDYILLLFTESTGHMALLAGGVLMGAGILVMRNMINFDF